MTLIWQQLEGPQTLQTLGLAAVTLVTVALVAWWRSDPIWAHRFVPWRQLALWGWQVLCWARGHQWMGRELDLMRALPGFRNPYLWICGRCGAAAVREEDGT